LQTKAFKHENIAVLGKETSSQNKKRILRLCNDLDKLSNSKTNNYESMDNTFKEIQKILDQR
jgi:N-glycosylase/DNA lyase